MNTEKEPELTVQQELEQRPIRKRIYFLQVTSDGNHATIKESIPLAERNFFNSNQFPDETLIGLYPDDFNGFIWEKFFGKSQEEVMNPERPWWKDPKVPMAGTIFFSVCAGFCAALAITNK